MREYISNQKVIPKLAGLHKADVEYYLFFVMIEFGEALNKGSSNQIFLAFAATAFFFLMWKLVNTHYTCQELITIAFLGILGAAIYYFTNKEGGILSLIALIGLKEVDSKKILKLTLYIRAVTLTLLMLLVSFDIIENTVFTNLRGGSMVIRYSMGFSHPNQFHLSFIIILLLLLFLYYEQLRIHHLILLGIINLLIYRISFSRTSTFIGLASILLMIWFKSNHFSKIRDLVCIGIIPFCFLISILPAVLYDKIPNLRAIDELLQWRITFSRHYLMTYPVNLFGNNLNGDFIVLDNGYVELLINYGLIFTILYAAAYIIISYRYLKKKMYRELLLIVCFSIYGITEAFIPNLFVNISLIFLGELLFHKSKGERRNLFES